MIAVEESVPQKRERGEGNRETLQLVGVRRGRMNVIERIDGSHPLFDSKILGRMNEHEGLPIHQSPLIGILSNWENREGWII